jgi:hypothetical protein
MRRHRMRGQGQNERDSTLTRHFGAGLAPTAASPLDFKRFGCTAPPSQIQFCLSIVAVAWREACFCSVTGRVPSSLNEPAETCSV